jgi:hypothetical protein
VKPPTAKTSNHQLARRGKHRSVDLRGQAGVSRDVLGQTREPEISSRGLDIGRFG